MDEEPDVSEFLLKFSDELQDRMEGLDRNELAGQIVLTVMTIADSVAIALRRMEDESGMAEEEVGGAVGRGGSKGGEVDADD